MEADESVNDLKSAFLTMNSLTVQQALQKLLETRKDATIEEIIDYLDYVNKVRYSRNEIIMMLAELTNERDPTK
ncbi:hypothetical protein [Dyadobacter pollutisoli]|uniref:Uncharacterized protein n=1 Tax=Dyadobacter pollutisoli TaxID=2910158 RepID=A0A9E8NC04_9BACT|nr:hypothetical protein [Dyadobacter pollutisoli]WAC12492.1 hypothetical protein ON006_00730 [Dyadobacter pollutisoli]WAC12508.1 hypothetical protein ON006_00810 [Dyadobacter pollutisoli]WAC12990.1 hypothetical protein ON006_03285 [Dyadobacter pollutisoli]